MLKVDSGDNLGQIIILGQNYPAFPISFTVPNTREIKLCIVSSPKFVL